MLAPNDPPEPGMIEQPPRHIARGPVHDGDADAGFASVFAARDDAQPPPPTPPPPTSPPPRRRLTVKGRRLSLALALLCALLPTMWSINPAAPPRADGAVVAAAPFGAAPPAPELLELEQVSREQAVAINAALPVSVDPVVAARPFRVGAGGGLLSTSSSALNCLTAAIYYEAASESDQGKRAVAQVVLNRVRHPAYPKSVCGVVYQGSERRTGCQFSFTCDGSLARQPSRAVWDRCRVLALMALNGLVEPSVGYATHYHTVWVVPYWAKSLNKIGVIGAHIFYRWRGFWGQPSAFSGQYAGEQAELPALTGTLPGTEPLPGALPGSLIAAPLPGTVEDPAARYRPLTPDFRVDAAPSPLAADDAPVAADGTQGRLAADDAAGTLIER